MVVESLKLLQTLEENPDFDITVEPTALSMLVDYNVGRYHVDYGGMMLISDINNGGEYKIISVTDLIRAEYGDMIQFHVDPEHHPIAVWDANAKIWRTNCEGTLQTIDDIYMRIILSLSNGKITISGKTTHDYGTYS
mgnify:FL=1